MLPLPAAGAGATGDTAMSSTQHQLIEQCATRLRGIVEALDNIHHTSPHRWSTDLDDVHSSAESLPAMINDQAPARSDTSFEEWLANELEGEDGQPVPAAVCDITLARRAFNHWPNLEKPAQVGAIRFHAGLSSRLVVEAAQRAYEYKATPEQEAERIERLQAFREQLDPLNLAPHAGAFNEAPDEALRPEQAEAERPEVVAYRTVGRHAKHQHPHFALNYYKQNAEDQAAHWRERGCEVSEDELMTVAQHERITAQLHDALDESDGDRWKLRSERDAALAEVKRLIGVCASLDSEKREIEHKRDSIIAMRDAAQARVAELERKLRDEENAHTTTIEQRDNAEHWADQLAKAIAERFGVDIGEHSNLNCPWNEALVWMQQPPAQAQHLHDLDKQCRDDVARALGLRPSQERGFAWSYLLASIKSCVMASEDAAQAQHSVPEGHALVPLEPTDDMLVAGQEAWAHKMERRGALEDCEEAGDVYRAMLAAAPGKEVGHE